MLEAMGINLLTRYNATPTTINATTRFIKGIFFYSSELGRSNLLPHRKGNEKVRRLRPAQRARTLRSRPGLAQCAVSTD
jgi:hypothetical protein